MVGIPPPEKKPLSPASVSSFLGIKFRGNEEEAQFSQSDYLPSPGNPDSEGRSLSPPMSLGTVILISVTFRWLLTCQ